MEFVKDPNPKKVRIQACSIVEQAWVSTLRSAALRINKGSERYAIKAYREWVVANGGDQAVLAKAKASAPEVAALAATWGAETNAVAPKWVPSAAAKAKAKAKNDKASAALNKLQYNLELVLQGAPFASKEEIAVLVSEANHISQLINVPLDLKGLSWWDKPAAIQSWADSLG